MAREKIPPPPGDDIPAWFMTYSDVITLLMTFFILLLTFATTEPERFEKTLTSTFSKGAATGTVGKKLESLDNDAWVSRIRPPASRIAMRGAEMPPIMERPASQSFGEGLRSLDDEESKQNEMTSHSFDVPFAQLFNSGGELTANGKLVCQMLAGQLRELPFQAAIQFAQPQQSTQLVKMTQFLFDTQQTRPGQVSLNLIVPNQKKPLDIKNVRITIKRFLENAESTR
jgi:flagellar motor protein MotB